MRGCVIPPTYNVGGEVAERQVEDARIADQVARQQARGIRQESEARKQSGASYADVDGPAAIAWLQATQARPSCR